MMQELINRMWWRSGRCAAVVFALALLAPFQVADAQTGQASY
jgi:hypothetical protein